MTAVRESTVVCKGCGLPFTYSEYATTEAARRGESRPERCPACLAKHTRQTSRIGAAYVDMFPDRPLPERGIKPGRLGKLTRAARPHTPIETPRPVIDPQEFGITDELLLEYLPELATKQVSIVQAPTGSGKSTFFPFRLMEPPPDLPRDLFTRHGRIIVTQPRIEATTGIPEFVAELYGASRGPGAMVDIGFRHSKATDKTDRRNRLVYLTDGTLLNMIRRGELSDVSIVMIDEAHERSLNIDLIIALMRRELQALPHLKLIIASATIEADQFRTFFEPEFDVLLRTFPGKTQHPIVDVFKPAEVAREEQLSAAMPRAVAERAYSILHWMSGGEPPEGIASATDPHDGDILAFLPGKRAIRNAIADLTELIAENGRLRGKVEVLPLHAELPEHERKRALGRGGRNKRTRWRVVLSTNLAETSLTVEGIRHVVDSGLINMTEWDSATTTQIIRPRLHSRAGLKQRRGRAGRVASGIWHCLLTAEQELTLAESTPPEIVRAPLEVVALAAMEAGYADPSSLRWLPPGPPPQELARSLAMLRSVDAVDPDGDPTAFGTELGASRENFTSTTVLLRADRAGCVVEAASVLAADAVGGAAALLRWEKQWPAATKLAVDRIHQAFMTHCLDDLDLICTVIAGWEAQANQDRKAWAARHFIDAAVVKALLAKRQTLMKPLLSRAKTDRLRPLDRRLLDRLRAVVGWALGDHAYVLFDDGTTYAPCESDSGLHRGAVVELDRRSRCKATTPPMIAVFKRERRRRWISPLEDPLEVVEVSLACALEPRHVAPAGGPLSLHLRNAVDRDLDASWRLPDVLPGDRFDASMDDSGTLVRLVRRRGSAVIADEPWGADEDNDRETGDLSESRSGSVGDDDRANQWETREESSTPAVPDERVESTKPQRVAYRGPRSALPGQVVCAGVGDDGRVLVEPDESERRLSAFAAQFAPTGHAGEGRAEFRVVRVARFQNDARVLVEVEHPDTRLVVPCDADAFGAGCRDAALADLKPGDPITMDVMWIDRAEQLVVLRRTWASSGALALLRESTDPRSATIIDAYDDKVYLRVDGIDPFVQLEVRAAWLPARPTEMRVGQVVRLSTRRRPSKPQYAELQEFSSDVQRALASVPGVEVEDDLLTTSEPIGLRTRQLLIAAAARFADEPGIPALVAKIDFLWRLGATPYINVIDVTGNRALIERGAGEARVIQPAGKGVEVLFPDGTKSWIPGHELSWERDSPTPTSGTTIQAFVKAGDFDAGVVELTLKDPARDPYRGLSEGMIVSAEVTKPDANGAKVLVEGRAEGYLRRAEAALAKGQPVADVLESGRRWTVRIVELDAEQRRLRVSRWLSRTSVTPDPARRNLLAELGPGLVITQLRDLLDADLQLDNTTFTLTIRSTEVSGASTAGRTIEDLFAGPAWAFRVGKDIGHWRRNQYEPLRELRRAHGVLTFTAGADDAAEVIVVAGSGRAMDRASATVYERYCLLDIAHNGVSDAVNTLYREIRISLGLARFNFVRDARGRAELRGTASAIGASIDWFQANGVSISYGDMRFDPAVTVRRLV